MSGCRIDCAAEPETHDQDVFRVRMKKNRQVGEEFMDYNVLESRVGRAFPVDIELPVPVDIAQHRQTRLGTLFEVQNIFAGVLNAVADNRFQPSCKKHQ